MSRGSTTDRWHRYCENGHEVHIHDGECPVCGTERTVGRTMSD